MKRLLLKEWVVSWGKWSLRQRFSYSYIYQVMPLGSTPVRVRRQDWAEVGAELDVITTKASTHPTGSSGIGIALQNCAFSGTGSGLYTLQ